MFLFCCKARRTSNAKQDSSGDLSTPNGDQALIAPAPESQAMALETRDTDDGTSNREWIAAVEEYCKNTNAEQYQALLSSGSANSFKTCSTYIQAEFAKYGRAGRVQNVALVLRHIDSFTKAFTSICQAGPGATMILWGSVQLLLKCALKVSGVLEKISQMMKELSDFMPRLNEYLDLFPTPRLKEAMKALYFHYITFYFDSASFLAKKKYVNFVRIIWSPLDERFEASIAEIKFHKNHFEEEAKLAGAQSVARFQERLEGRSNEPQSQDVIPQSASSIIFSRNNLFSGRDGIMQQLSKALGISDHEVADSPRLKSCTLHGVAGVGKTQIALEFMYRMRTRYKHVFWLRAGSDVELAASMERVASVLGLHWPGLIVQDTARAALRWLNETTDSWLLVYDNLETLNTVLQYWPYNEHGSILMTTQNILSSSLTRHQIRVDPMTPDEGRELILRQLRSDRQDLNANASENVLAETLSKELGGLPLALAHYTAFVTRSQLSLGEFLDMFRRYRYDVAMWSSRGLASMNQYEKTLDTVWDLAMANITLEGRELLDTLAFLHPDAVPEMLLIIQREEMTPEASSAALISLRTIAAGLLELHLIERDGHGENACFRMHRVLKRNLLKTLDEDPSRRQLIFDRAVQMVRRVFPRRSTVTRIVGSTRAYELFLPQVITLRDDYERLPPIKGNMILADLLCDAMNFLFDQQFLSASTTIGRTALKIAEEELPKHSSNPIMVQILGLLGTNANLAGDFDDARVLLKRVVELREVYMRETPKDEQSQTDHIDLARSWNDYGESFLVAEDLDTAEYWVRKALNKYKELGTEQTLPYRFAIQYATLCEIQRGQRGKFEEAITHGKRGFELAESALGPDNYWVTVFKFEWALALLIQGNFDQSLELFSEIYTTRKEIKGNEDEETLEIMYWIGTANFHKGSYVESAEVLEKALQLREAAKWGQKHVARAMLRLALVSEHLRPDRVSDLVQQALEILPQLDHENANILQLLAECEKRITVSIKGRSTGLWEVHGSACSGTT